MGTRVLQHWVLGPSGKIELQDKFGSREPNRCSAESSLGNQQSLRKKTSMVNYSFAVAVGEAVLFLWAGELWFVLLAAPHAEPLKISRDLREAFSSLGFRVGVFKIWASSLVSSSRPVEQQENTSRTRR